MHDQLSAFASWLAPIAAAIVISAGQALVALGQRRLNAKMDEGERRRNEARAETEAKRRAEAEWRERVEGRMDKQDMQMDLITTSLQSTMRQSLIHAYEKYASRGWLTTEELSSWIDMHDKYSGMGFNGLIDTYRDKIVELEIRPLDEISRRD